MKTLGVGYAIIEIKTDLEKEIFDQNLAGVFFIDYFNLVNKNDKREFKLSYTEYDFITILNERNNIEVHVRMKGPQDCSFNQINCDSGVEPFEITNKFVADSIVESFGAAYLKDNYTIPEENINLISLKIGGKEIEISATCTNAFSQNYNISA